MQYFCGSNYKTIKMKNNNLAQKIKALRNRKGFSQEELSTKTGLSLRTIQRIENGETEPRGYSLKQLATAFEVSPDEIVDWTIQEDKGFLVSLNLSALGFLIFPILGILIPLIIWIAKKDKIRGLNELAKDVLIFQIAWTILLFIGLLANSIIMSYQLNLGNISADIITSRMMFILIFGGVMYLFNLTMIIINSIRINIEKPAKYYPKILFLKK